MLPNHTCIRPQQPVKSKKYADSIRDVGDRLANEESSWNGTRNLK